MNSRTWLGRSSAAYIATAAPNRMNVPNRTAACESLPVLLMRVLTKDSGRGVEFNAVYTAGPSGY